MVMAERMNGSDVVESEANGHVQPRAGEMSYSVMVSPRFIVMSLLSSVLLAFAVGRAARLLLLEGPRNAILLARRQSTLWPDYDREASLPSIVARDAKLVPQTRYLSKNFDTSRSSSSSYFAKSGDSVPSAEEKTCSLNENGECEDVEKQLLSLAAHLMVDIKHVDGEFLNSESRLANAMLQVANEAELTLLSYHCHALTPMGVSCVGVLLHNYMSFHTWPVEGVITFDLCVGGTTDLLHALPIIKRFFGVTQPGRTTEMPEIRWAHKVRGFAEHDRLSNLLSSTDLGLSVLTNLNKDVKEEVASVHTQFQRIDIFDLLQNKKQMDEPYKQWQMSQRHSDKSSVQPLFRPERIIMLDGWIQSTLYNEAAYHEALVQPAMFTNANPKRVSIIGGGEGATLREVLKHNTIEEVVMIEIDERMVSVSRDYIPEWSDCSDLKGSAVWCVEDPRATMYYEDALAWFMDRYANGGKSKNDPMDVIIMDALDPEFEIPFTKALYGNDAVMKTFYTALSNDGILVMQLGESPNEFNPDETHSKFKNRAATTSLLERAGFESIQVYEESHCGFTRAWTFVVAFKSYSTRKRWYANAAQFNLEIQKRGVRTKSGVSPFRYFDGPTMVSYQVPHRAVEIVFCRREPTPEKCMDGQAFFDSNYPNAPLSSFEVKKSSVSDNAGRGLFAKISIAQGTYFSAETSSQRVLFMPSTVAIIEALEEEPIGHELASPLHYMYGYGFSSRLFGELEVIVDSDALTFVNHGCKGSNNIGVVTAFDEETANMNVMPDEVGGKSHEGTSIFNPFVDRHLTFGGCTSNRDIQAGEEILDNYLAFVSNKEDWADYVISLRNQCAGKGIGEVTEYERAH